MTDRIFLVFYDFAMSLIPFKIDLFLYTYVDTSSWNEELVERHKMGIRNVCW